MLSNFISIFLLFLVFQTPPQRSAEDELGVCSWSEYGCEYFVVHYNDGTGDAYANCGDGAYYYGTGSYGTCTGFYESTN